MAPQVERIAAVGALALLLAVLVAAEYPETYRPQDRIAQQDAPMPAPAAIPPQTGLGDTPQATAPSSGVAAESFVDYTIGAGSESGGNFGFTGETTAPATAARGQ
jgi:hypothetical protein